MKKQNGFIATSLLYSFFLVFITIFIGMVSIYIKNRTYIINLEDSSKKNIYIREIKDRLAITSLVKIEINGVSKEFNDIPTNNIFTSVDGFQYNLGKCNVFYYDNDNYQYIVKECS